MGSTDNVLRRIPEHNAGKNRFTKAGIPWELLLVEEYKTRSEAMRREKYLKSGIGRKYLDKILKK